MNEFMSSNLSDFEILETTTNKKSIVVSSSGASDEETLARQYIAMLTNNKVAIFR